MSSDTNLIIRKKNGWETTVIYPLRVFLEYDTPWLDKPGVVQTSNPVKDLIKFRNEDYFTYGGGGRFVISTWEKFPKYNERETDGRTATIFLADVESVYPAPPSLTKIGNDYRENEDNVRNDENYKKGVVSRRELALLFPHLADQILTRPR